VKRIFLLVLVALIQPIAWPAWGVERIVRIKYKNWQFWTYSAIPYFFVLAIVCSIALLWLSPTWGWVSLYPMTAMLVVSLWACIAVGVGRVSNILLALLKFTKRDFNEHRRGLLFGLTTLYVSLITYLYIVYYFAFLGMLLHKSGVSTYAGITAQSQLEMLWLFIYYSTVTITTLGYGDIHPLAFWGQLATALEVLLGVSMMAFIFGGFVSIHINKLLSAEK